MAPGKVKILVALYSNWQNDNKDRSKFRDITHKHYLVPALYSIKWTFCHLHHSLLYFSIILSFFSVVILHVLYSKIYYIKKEFTFSLILKAIKVKKKPVHPTVALFMKITSSQYHKNKAFLNIYIPVYLFYSFIIYKSMSLCMWLFVCGYMHVFKQAIDRQSCLEL